MENYEIEKFMVNYNDDFVIRYGDEEQIFRTQYMTFKDANKEFNKLKLDSKVIWAELIYEDLNKLDHQEVLDSFEKQVQDFGFCKFVMPLKSK